MPIKKWPISERPREKLIRHGVSTLSDAELLAIIIGNGNSKQSAVDISRNLLTQFKGLRGIFAAPLSDFCKKMGVGLAKYCQLQATAELGRRFLRETLPQRQTIHHSLEAQNFIIAHLRDFQQEVFVGLFLDHQHRIIEFEQLFHGTINSTSIYPREIVKRALHYNASALIVAHNHPSGIPEPSPTDQETTLWLKNALQLVEIKLLDHLIVGDNQAISLAERGFL